MKTIQNVLVCFQIELFCTTYASFYEGQETISNIIMQDFIMESCKATRIISQNSFHYAYIHLTSSMRSYQNHNYSVFAQYYGDFIIEIHHMCNVKFDLVVK